MVAIESFTHLSKFRVSTLSPSQQLHWTAQTSGHIPAKSESAGNIIWVGQGATSTVIPQKASPTTTAKGARRQMWHDALKVLERAHQHPEWYEHMTDEWLDEVRDGSDDRLADIYGADYWD